MSHYPGTCVMTARVEWLVAAEKMPDDDTTVLLAIDGDVWIGWHDADGWHNSDGMPLRGVTHWAHTPEVPA